MDPISHRLDHWVRFISRLATLSISMHQGYHSARSTLASFLSLLGTIFRAIANLSRSHFFGLGLPLGLGSSSSSSSSSRLEVQDLLLLVWALLRVFRHHILRRVLRRVPDYLPVGVVGLVARVRPALLNLEMPGWLRQLASAPAPLLPSSSARHPFGLPPSAHAAAALPFGLPGMPGLPGLPANTPWHLANYRQGLPSLPPAYFQGQPMGYYPPTAATAAAVSVPSAPLSGQPTGHYPPATAVSAPPSAPASSPPAVPAQTPGLHQLRQLRQQRQLQQSQSGPGSGGGGGTPR